MVFLFIAVIVIGILVASNLSSRIIELSERVKLLEHKLRQFEPSVTPPPEPSAPRLHPAEPSATPSPAPRPSPRPAPSVSVEKGRDPVEEFFFKVKQYFTTGNTIVKVGVILIFFGVAFLLKYAVENSILPIELRLIGSAIGGLTLVGLGWRFRSRTREYGLILQGGGIGVLIITTFVSMKFYELISPSLAFGLLIAYTVLTSILAVLQNSQNLAAFGICGGFLAPVLVSTGQGNHVVLFSYYSLLNLGILFMSWQKAWRKLNLLGFIFTFAISSFWGVLKYQPEFFGSTQPFLILFFLLYVAIPLLFARKQEPELKGYVDGTIVFGNSVLTLIFQLELVKGTPYAGAFSALALAAFYIGLSRFLIRHPNRNYGLLAEAFVAIGTVFVTIAIPLAFDGVKTSAIWALEAAGIYWFAIRQNRRLPRYFSSLLIFTSSLAFLFGPTWGNSETIFLNTFFFSCLMMAAGFLTISYLAERNSSRLSEFEAPVPWLSFVFGSAWWVLGGLYEIDRFTFSFWRNARTEIGRIPFESLLNVQLAYLSVATAAFFVLSRRLDWNRGRYLSHGFVVILLLAFLRGLGRYAHPFESLGYLAWVGAFAVSAFILFMNDRDLGAKESRFLKFGHAVALWSLVGVIARELGWLAGLAVEESTSWAMAAKVAFPVFAVWMVTEKPGWLRWPVQKNRMTYLVSGLLPIVTLLWLWAIISNWSSDGNASPLPYLPILNPLELAHLAALFVVSLWFFRLLKAPSMTGKLDQKSVGIVMGLTYFFWLNGVLCRALHHYAGIPFFFSALFDSVIVQVALSLYWTLLGIALMVSASRQHRRWLWLVGAGLLTLVVAKMFLVDLSKTGTIARVVSFLGVGVLFLIVGYFSPIPPKAFEVEVHEK